MQKTRTKFKNDDQYMYCYVSVWE